MVHGGGGISPDIEVEPDRLSRFFVALRRSGFLFDFAVEYAAVNELPDDFDSFEVGDDILEQFHDYIRDPAQADDFTYLSAAQLRFKAFEESLKDTELSDAGSEALDVLKEEVMRERENEFERTKERIRKVIGQYITLRRWGVHATILAQLKGDKQFEEAVQILNQPELYQEEMKVALH